VLTAHQRGAVRGFVARFALATWPELVQLAYLKGPSAIIEQVRDAERSDSAGNGGRTASPRTM
jgi:hypothetical protein